MIEELERKISTLKESYESELRMIRSHMKDERDIWSSTFERNMIAHLVEMNSIKMRLAELEQMLTFLKIEAEENRH